MKTRNRIKAILLAVMMIMTTVITPFADAVTVKASEDLVLKLHYHRADENYDGWDVWLWEAGGEGSGYAFAEEDGEMVATKVVTPGVTSVGFIVRTADWAKDIDKDQFIDISEMVSGTVHVYVESGVEGYTKEYGEDAKTGTKLTKARYDEETQLISVKMTGALEGDALEYLTVMGVDGEISVSEVTEGEQFEYLLKVDEALDLTKNYNILFDGNSYKVVMPNIYSTEAFEAEFTYEGDDLGATWSSAKTVFRVWAPTAEAVKVNLYESGTEGEDDLIEQLEMQPIRKAGSRT